MQTLPKAVGCYSRRVEWALAILALSLLIVVHEFGHYLAAVATGMQVDRFSVLGIGPVILRLGHYKGTEFVISAIPFGAYVHIVGMEPADEDEPATKPISESHLFRDKSLGARLLVIVGGPAANYLAASAILFSIFAAVGVRTPMAMQVSGFHEVSAAQSAGLLEGDELVRIGERTVEGETPGPRVLAATSEYKGTTVDVTVRRNDQLVTMPVALAPEAPVLGTNLVESRFEAKQLSVVEAGALAVARPFEISKLQLVGLYRWITGQIESRLGGPVEITRQIKRSAEAGIVSLLTMAAFISTLLGLFNLLPLPALDGGRLAFLFYELVARKPANRRVEEMIHGIGMVALLGLIAYATVGDIRN